MAIKANGKANVNNIANPIIEPLITPPARPEDKLYPINNCIKADIPSIPMYMKNTDNMAYNLRELLINNRIGTMTKTFQTQILKKYLVVTTISLLINADGNTHSNMPT